jgi:arabinogalactan oligomer/maltooligosaccharide transport system substrate-binding protein
MQKRFPPIFRGQCIARAGSLLLAVAVVALLVVSPVSAAHRGAEASSLVVWADTPQQASIQRSAATWGRAPVTVVVHSFSSIQADLKTVTPENAPDIIIGQHDWIGDLVTNGLVLPIFPSAATKAQFPQYALDAFSYGIALKKLYGAPYAFDNVGVVVNTQLVKVPATFAQLERRAIAFKKRKSGNLGIAVPQGAGGDAFHMYPFFSGLGGYVFGKNKIGLLDPSDIGVANRTFVANSSLIDKWNREGLINSKVDYETAKNAFLNKQAAFWITGPWEADALKSSGLKFKIIQMPKIKLSSVPFLNVQGMMVTKYARDHTLDTLARDFVSNYMMTSAAQLDLAKANGRAPANITASKKYSDPIASQFGKAGVGGVPVPNIPQMSQVWTELGLAWVRSTQGTGATRAGVAFKTAARNIAEKIG